MPVAKTNKKTKLNVCDHLWSIDSVAAQLHNWVEYCLFDHLLQTLTLDPKATQLLGFVRNSTKTSCIICMTTNFTVLQKHMKLNKGDKAKLTEQN